MGSEGVADASGPGPGRGPRRARRRRWGTATLLLAVVALACGFGYSTYSARTWQDAQTRTSARLDAQEQRSARLQDRLTRTSDELSTVRADLASTRSRLDDTLDEVRRCHREDSRARRREGPGRGPGGLPRRDGGDVGAGEQRARPVRRRPRAAPGLPRHDRPLDVRHGALVRGPRRLGVRRREVARRRPRRQALVERSTGARTARSGGRARDVRGAPRRVRGGARRRTAGGRLAGDLADDRPTNGHGVDDRTAAVGPAHHGRDPVSDDDRVRSRRLHPAERAAVRVGTSAAPGSPPGRDSPSARTPSSPTATSSGA